MIKQITLSFLLLGTSLISSSQTDSTQVLPLKEDTLVIKAKNDTIKIGSLLIVTNKEAKKPAYKTIIKVSDESNSKPNEGEGELVNGDFKKTKFEISKGPKKIKNIETNWWIFDIGLSNFIDKSVISLYGPIVYPNPHTTLAYPMMPEDFSLNNRRSTNVNVWVVTQKLNLIQHKINLKYGLGIEMFNFRFDKSISFRETYGVQRDYVSFTKNKLLVKYLTIPLQLNFSPNPTNKKAFYASIGMSAGYLWNAKNKQISGERGKEKYRGNFNLNDWRFATIGELGVGAIRLYGSFANSNLLNKELISDIDLQPFAVGLRFSKF